MFKRGNNKKYIVDIRYEFQNAYQADSHGHIFRWSHFSQTGISVTSA